jgi:hypothetical protein
MGSLSPHARYTSTWLRGLGGCADAPGAEDRRGDTGRKPRGECQSRHDYVPAAVEPATRRLPVSVRSSRRLPIARHASPFARVLALLIISAFVICLITTRLSEWTTRLWWRCCGGGHGVVARSNDAAVAALASFIMIYAQHTAGSNRSSRAVEGSGARGRSCRRIRGAE